jgi:N-acetylglucosaminyldiphosphoundecaprenol N-acetyl-beta-D-mannosaminyltransferase
MIALIDVFLSSTSYSQSIIQIDDWVKQGEGHYICAANVHMVMEAHDSSSFRKIVNDADLVTPDGMPLVWMMRLKGEHKQERVYGPTLMLQVLDMAQRNKIPVGFYGGSPDVLNTLVERMHEKYPALIIKFSLSPHFGQMSAEEDKLVVEMIRQSAIRILFVGLGCPKQEIWMAAHKDKIPAVMIGVGAAFDFHAGKKAQSPSILQRIGLEWLFRLFHEPKRLWRRYLYNNPRFVFLAIADLLGFYNPR